MKGRKYQITVFPTVLGLALGLMAMVPVGCKKPALREGSETPPLEETPLHSNTSKDFREIRKETIGRKFAKLTLGARQFTDVEVLDITDKVIRIKHSGGTGDLPWKDMPEEVRDRWGYRPEKTALVKTLNKLIPKSEESTDEMPLTSPAPEPKERRKSQQEKAQEIARRQKMLEAQMAGIRSLESDYSRESRRLIDLRRRYQLSLARQRAQGTKGIRVERIGGESALIDRAKEARELNAQIKTLEPLVAQLSGALQEARQNYQNLRNSLDRSITK